MIKIKWEGKYEKHPVKKFERFSELIDRLAIEKNVDRKTIILMLDSNVIQDDDTPESIGIKISHILSEDIFFFVSKLNFTIFFY